MRLGSLPIGSRVLEPQSALIFTVADRRDGGYPGMTMLSERIVTAACLDGAEPDATGDPRWDGWARFGRNDYPGSTLHRWLNSAQEDWYAPAHPYDRPPSPEHLRYGEQPNLDRPGFLGRFSPVFRSALLDTPVQVLERMGKDQGRLVQVTAKLFLPSRTEIAKGDESGFAEGRPLPLCYDPGQVHRIRPVRQELERCGRSWNPAHEGAPLDAPQIYDPRFGWWYWLRTPSLRYGFLARVVSAYGAVSYTYANNDIVGVRPMCCLEPDLEVELFHPLRADETGVKRRLYRVADSSRPHPDGAEGA